MHEYQSLMNQGEVATGVLYCHRRTRVRINPL